MFKKLREKQAEMAARAIAVPRGALFCKLRQDGYQPADAAIIVFATHPLDEQEPNSRAFEDAIRRSCIAHTLDVRGTQDKLVNLVAARHCVSQYLRMAMEAGEEYYVDRFRKMVADHVQKSETIPMSPEERELFAPRRPRRSEPLRANRA